MSDALFDLERTTGPRVWNKYQRSIPEGAVWIGRPSPWGNPFVVGENGVTREEAIALYKEYLNENPALKAAIKRELKGKDLVCACKPAPCHGDLILAIANS